MDKDQVSGKFDQVAGKVKQTVGDAVGNSKLAQNTLDKALKLQGTARNWNTVTKLQSLAQAWK